MPTDAPGFLAPEIKHKLSLRASVTSELVLDGVRLPADAVLPEVRGLKGPLSCLNEVRYGIVLGAMGAARSSLYAALSYAGERTQFGKPISAYQLIQQSWSTCRWSTPKVCCVSRSLRGRIDHAAVIDRSEAA
jgi:glutaryl-CoA dehydrogenase